jgi:hypothetical protein
MGGGLMQLVATGPEDVYLTSDPQITFFKVMYRRYTNFSSESIEQTFNSTGDFGKTVSCIIAKNGDLITKLFVKITLEKTVPGEKYGFVQKLGHTILNNIKVDIGGTVIDEHYSDWLNIWNELTLNKSMEDNYNVLIGNIEKFIKIEENKEELIMYIPLLFWFCRNNGLALPLIALQYHKIKIQVKFANLDDCVIFLKDKVRNDIKFKDTCLIINYIYLDGEERKRFAASSHEYLIEQLQYMGDEIVTASTETFKLNFMHPCKALFWVIKMGYNLGKNYTIAINNDGLIDINYFAKIIWMLTRNAIYNYQKSKYYINLNITDQILKNSLNIDIDPNTSNEIKNILAKIDAEFIFCNADNTINLNNLDNIFLNKNELNSLDISITYQDIYNGLTGDIQKEILDQYAYNLHVPSNYSTYIDNTFNPVQYGELKLNGHNRFQKREGNYFNYVQPYQHFSKTPSDGINVYSFSINPEEHQPSGCCNMSRIDNSSLIINLENENENINMFIKKWLGKTIINIYTVNYNVLRIMGGMAGLAYLN